MIYSSKEADGPSSSDRWLVLESQYQSCVAWTSVPQIEENPLEDASSLVNFVLDACSAKREVYLSAVIDAKGQTFGRDAVAASVAQGRVFRENSIRNQRAASLNRQRNMRVQPDPEARDHTLTLPALMAAWERCSARIAPTLVEANPNDTVDGLARAAMFSAECHGFQIPAATLVYKPDNHVVSDADYARVLADMAAALTPIFSAERVRLASQPSNVVMRSPNNLLNG
jgi:hypothetical protein